jgi:hypothetical protein
MCRHILDAGVSVESLISFRFGVSSFMSRHILDAGVSVESLISFRFGVSSFMSTISLHPKINYSGPEKHCLLGCTPDISAMESVSNPILGSRYYYNTPAINLKSVYLH